MSDLPPPLSNENESTSNVEIDLNTSGGAQRPLNEDLFFSTISDPAPSEEVSPLFLDNK